MNFEWESGFLLLPSQINQSHENIKVLGPALPTSEEPGAGMSRKLDSLCSAPNRKQRSEFWWEEERPEGRAVMGQPIVWPLEQVLGCHKASESCTV